MGENKDQNERGSPHQFVGIFQKAKNLPKMKSWAYEDDNNRQKAIKDLEANLREGIPAAYCRDGHCVMIYGFSTDGKALKFNIADSVGSKKYSESSEGVARRYSGLWTMPRTSYRKDSEETIRARERHFDEHPLSTGARE